MEYFSHCASDFVPGVKLHKLPIVYVISTTHFEYLKIGISRSFKQRFSNIQTACPFKLSLWLGIRSPRPEEIEDVLHEMFCEFNIRGEWFFMPNPELDKLAKFCELTNKNVREVSCALL